jgi:hypothetical protein
MRTLLRRVRANSKRQDLYVNPRRRLPIFTKLELRGHRVWLLPNGLVTVLDCHHTWRAGEVGKDAMVDIRFDTRSDQPASGSPPAN